MDHGPLGLVCQTCGDEGFTNAYIYCVKCLRFVIHRYCLNIMPRTTDEFVPWFCEDCKPAALPPKHDPSRLHKEDHTIKIAIVKTPKRKKKQIKGQSKKRKIVPVLAEVKDKVCYPEKDAAGLDHGCVSLPIQIKNNVVLGLEKEDAGPDHECVSGPNQIKNNVVLGSEKEAAGPDHECVSRSNQIRSNVVLGLEKDVFQKQSSLSTQLNNCPTQKHKSLQYPEHVKTTKSKKKQKKRRMKIVPLVVVRKDNVNCPEEVTKPNGEDANQIIPCVDKGVSEKQSSESKNQATAIPETESLRSQKKDATTNSAQLDTINGPTNSAPLETIKHKKKQKKKPKKKQIKKKKIVSLVAGQDEEATKPNHECISPTNSPHKVASDSEPNQITLCVSEKDVFQQQHSSESAELDNNCCPVDKIVKRKSDTTSLAMRRKRHITGNSIVEHSSCESSCTDAPLKHSVEEQEQEQRCELKQSNIADLESDSSSIEKELNKQTVEIETENRMHQEQGAYASQSAFLENNIHAIHYQPARPIINPLWRGNFNIVRTDYNVFEGLVGHLSSKACARVRDEAFTLPSLLCLEMHPKSALWPKSFLESPPSDENIALYFLPGSTRNERDLERLVNDMIFEELAMKATTKNAELLIFTSKVLPEPYWTFQGSYYLWGVFRRKKNDDHGPAASNTSDSRGLSSYQVPK